MDVSRNAIHLRTEALTLQRQQGGKVGCTQAQLCPPGGRRTTSVSTALSVYDNCDLRGGYDSPAPIVRWKYVGSHPIKLRKSMWKDRNMEVVRKKQREKKKLSLR
ncbi:unnamed protein product [Arctogadus glacialis]